MISPLGRAWKPARDKRPVTFAAARARPVENSSE
jgi:hypothetical protein